MKTKDAPGRQSPSIPEYVADTLPSEMLQELGKIIFLWGRLEFQLSNLLGVAFDLPKDTQRALMVGMDVSALCKSIQALVYPAHWVTEVTLRKRIDTLWRKVRDCCETRNKYAHGVFGYDIERINEFSIYLFRETRQKISPDAEPISLETLRADSEAARLMLSEAIDLTVMLKAWKQKAAAASALLNLDR